MAVFMDCIPRAAGGNLSLSLRFRPEEILLMFVFGHSACPRDALFPNCSVPDDVQCLPNTCDIYTNVSLITSTRAMHPIGLNMHIQDS